MLNYLNAIYQKRPVALYFLLTYVVVLLISADTVSFAKAYAEGLGAFIFLISAWLCYGLFYLLPAIVLTKITHFISNLGSKGNKHTKPTYLMAIVAGGITTLLLYANAKIFSLYGMFINGFILNLLMTPGGIESLGGSSQSDIGFAIIALGFFALQAVLFWLAYICTNRSPTTSKAPKKMRLISLATIIVAVIGVHFAYAVDSFNKNKLTPLAETVPFFQPVSARHFFSLLGYKVNASQKLEIKGHLRYPLKPIQYQQPAKPYNIIWLTSESWRADVLDPEIMPYTWEFASHASRFTHNYSGGNGTRMGVFSMFMGMPGNYWFQFLNEQRGAAIIDVMQKQGYQMNLYTSARFSYPEFEKTIFSQIPADKLHSLGNSSGQGWEKDRKNVSSLLDFIDKRDTSKPFFTFMFFESPHARYYFPPESVIRQPYRDDINYATLSKEELRNDIVPIKNRYINSVHHLDSQFGRIFTYLKEKNLLDSTIVIMLGDHGEEFMEHGYWGHNSTYVDQQIRTPLVIWVPGKAPKVDDRMASHMDIIPTIMPLLGVTNPTTDYALGYDLFSDLQRKYTYSSDWDKITYIDHEVKIMQPISIRGFARNQISSADDRVLSSGESTRLMKNKQQAMLQTMQDLTHFMGAKHNK